MALIGVLTGDIVGSTKIEGNDRDFLLSLIKSLLLQNADRETGAVDIFRGDSFQLVLSSAASAVKAAISIRSGLMFNTPARFSSLWDARISVGIAFEEYRGQDVGTSDGEAFRLSGRKLDEMKASRLAIQTEVESFNNELAVEAGFVDDIVTHWSRNQAHVAHMYCRPTIPPTKEIAKNLNVSNQRINQLYHSAKVPLLLPFFSRFENMINSIVQ